MQLRYASVIEEESVVCSWEGDRRGEERRGKEGREGRCLAGCSSKTRSRSSSSSRSNCSSCCSSSKSGGGGGAGGGTGRWKILVRDFMTTIKGPFPVFSSRQSAKLQVEGGKGKGDWN